ncbi:MAG: DUF1444 family protein [Woeseiaceae bacterium]|nr:DUF1444 family protein [Woeseiaceae bacterium]
MLKWKARAVVSLLVLAGLFGLVSPAAAELTPDEFTARFIDNLRKADAEIGIEDVKSLEFVVKTDDGTEYTAFLDNAYSLYLQDESMLQEVLDQYAAGLLESASRDESELVAENIVPVVKDAAWLEEVLRLAAPEYMTYPLVDDLIVIYAEDTPANIRYIQKEDIEETGIDMAEIANLSIENLLARLPGIEVHGGEGLYMVTAGGNYEPSLLLIDDMWNADNFDVQGEIVVSIPARDMLLVSGADDPDKLDQLVEIGTEVYEGSPYRLTTNLYVWRDSAWQLFVR